MSDFRIDPDTNPGRGTRFGLIFLFVIICAGLIGGAVWLFYFSGYLVDPQQGPQQQLRYIEIKIDDISLSLREGETQRLGIKYVKTADSRDIDTRALRIQWHSENPQVATVSPRGDVMAHSQGSARISAYVVSDTVSSNTVYCQVSVWPKIADTYPRLPADSLSRDTMEGTVGLRPADASPSTSPSTPAATKPSTPVATKPSTPASTASKEPTKAPDKERSSDINDRVRGRLQKK